MEMKSRVVQLCIDVTTWSIVVILRLRRIQVKREIVRIVIGIVVKIDETLEIKNEQVCTVGAHVSRLMAKSSRLMKI